MSRSSTGANDPLAHFQRLHDKRYGPAASWFPGHLLATPQPPQLPQRLPPPPGSVVLGHDPLSGQPVTMAPQPRLNGLYVVGLMGMGKSSLLEELIVQDMRLGHGLCLLDPHRDLVEHCLARVPAGREQDVVLLDLHTTARPFGINLFDCRDPGDPLIVAETQQRVMRVFKRLWGPQGENPSWGVYIEEVLSRATAAFLDNPGCSLRDLPRLLTDADFRRRVVAGVRNPDVRHFWEVTFGGRSDREQRAYADSTRNKVERFLDSELTSNIVGQGRTSFDLAEIVNSNGILFVQLDPMLDELTALVGSLLVELIADISYGRPEGQRRNFFIYADEAQRFATSQIDRIIPQIRKFGTGFVLAHQWRNQLARNPALREATGAMGSTVVFKVKPDDARELVDRFSTDPDPRRQLVLDPLGQLEREGHPSDAVHALVRRLRRQLAEERRLLERQVGEERARFNDRWSGGGQRPVAAGTELAALRARINDYLVAAMTGEEHGTTELGSPTLTGIVEQLGDRLAEHPLAQPAADQVATRSGRRSQLEAELRRQDRFCARASLLVSDDAGRELTAEYSLRTPPFRPLDTSPAAAARGAAIRAQSARSYGTAVAPPDSRQPAPPDDHNTKTPAGRGRAPVRSVPPSAPIPTPPPAESAAAQDELVAEVVVSDDD